MTNQETFDTVARGLLKQGRQSIDPCGGCRYRHITDDGVTLKCAAGMLMPDEKYDPMFEGLAITHPNEYVEPWFDESISRLRNIFIDAGHDLTLVTDLVRVHDRFGFFSGEWVKYILSSMADLAERWGLSDAVLREQG